MSIGIATTTFEIGSSDGNIQLTPTGYFRAIDGRPKETELKDGWYVDSDIAKNIIQQLSVRKNPIVVDYNHASLIDGNKAPAAGWIRGPIGSGSTAHRQRSEAEAHQKRRAGLGNHGHDDVEIQVRDGVPIDRPIERARES